MKRFIAELLYFVTAAAVLYGLIGFGWLLREMHEQATAGAIVNAARARYYHARAIYYEDLNAETRRRERARRPPDGNSQAKESLR
jgi:hypothetical protein